MQLLPFLYPALVALLTITPTTTAATKKTPKIPKDAILLSQVKTLTLRSNSQTAHRRVSAVPQLTCKGPACRHHTIDTLRCKNQGSSYGDEDIEWSCTASLPEEFKLGSTEVICEGYDSSDDPYVLKGSCGVEYRLVYTDKGEEKYGKSWDGPAGEKSSAFAQFLFVVLFVGVLGWILYAACQGATGQNRVPRPRGNGGWNGGGWGGGGGNPPHDPPPPYPGRKYEDESSESWRPGFWSGTAAGGAAGYAAGRMAGNRQQDPLLNNNRGSSWFGGGNRESSFAGPSRSAPSRSGSSSSSSASTTRHESTGFGSTSRR